MSSLRRFWRSCLCFLVFRSESFYIVLLSNLLTLGVSDEGCYRNASSSALNLIATFLLLSPCWWTISSRVYLPPNKRMHISLSVVFLVNFHKRRFFSRLMLFYFRVRSKYSDFLHIPHLLMQKLLKHIAPTLQSSLQHSYGRHRELVLQIARGSFPFMHTN